MNSALRAAIKKIPTREERLGGQTFKYVKLSEVLDLLDTSPVETNGDDLRTHVERSMAFDWTALDLDALHQVQHSLRLALRGSPLEPEDDDCTDCYSTGDEIGWNPHSEHWCACARGLKAAREHAPEKAKHLPFARRCDRCKQLVASRQPVTSTVFYCSIECAE